MLSRGLGIGWTSARPERQSRFSAVGCGAYKAGGCVSVGGRSRRRQGGRRSFYYGATFLFPKHWLAGGLYAYVPLVLMPMSALDQVLVGLGIFLVGIAQYARQEPGGSDEQRIRNAYPRGLGRSDRWNLWFIQHLGRFIPLVGGATLVVVGLVRMVVE